MPLVDSKKRPKFIRYSCIQFTDQYIYYLFSLDIYNTLKYLAFFWESQKA